MNEGNINTSGSLSSEPSRSDLPERKIKDNQAGDIAEDGGRSKKSYTPLVIGAVLTLAAVGVGGGIAGYLVSQNKKINDGANNSELSGSEIDEEIDLAETLDGQVQNFDLAFLKLENKAENAVYSPLSIKYALGMLEAGANGESKKQINDVIGNYIPKKYTNSDNMSFVNAMFIRDSFSSAVKDSYLTDLTNRFNAEVIYDSFATPEAINNWVSDKTFNLINNVLDDSSGLDFALVNALAIDMEWKNQIRADYEFYSVNFPHIEYRKWISNFMGGMYSRLEFGEDAQVTKSIEIGAVANKYDILNEVGEEKIREIVTAKYEEWLAEEAATCLGDYDSQDVPDVNAYIEQYMEEIGDGGYQHVSSSTDFYFYDDEDVKVFAKDLEEYDGTALQYVGIMPKEEALPDYVKHTTASELSKLVNGLKSIELDNFKDGVITEIYGYIPVFNFDYQLNLKDDLRKLGVEDVFDDGKADLSNMTDAPAYINTALHKTDIDFSNNGIKAAAATVVGGFGHAEGCHFDYKFEPPVEKIDLTFDRPYLFLIRDKDSREVWFAGTVYQPTEY